MANRVSLSYEEQSLNEIASYYSDVQAGLIAFFSGASATLLQRYQLETVGDALDKALNELDVSSSFSVLSSLEATIRLDYLRRVYDRRRDRLSRAMRLLHRAKENHAQLEGDLIRLWRQETDMSRIGLRI